jgi:hypothetical protein
MVNLTTPLIGSSRVIDLTTPPPTSSGVIDLTTPPPAGPSHVIDLITPPARTFVNLTLPSIGNVIDLAGSSDEEAESIGDGLKAVKCVDVHLYLVSTITRFQM